MKDIEQNDIIEGIVAGNEQIIKEFYKKHLPQITSFITRNSGNKSDAEDIFQDAMVFIYEKLESNSLELSCSLGTYLYGVCRNMWMNKLKRSHKEIQHEGMLSVAGQDSFDVIDEISEKERNFIYQKYFVKLGPACQDILSGFFEGLSMKEIAKRRDSTESYIKKKKFDCKKRLITMIKEDPAFEELKKDHL